jgi:hypothetical protein
MDETAKKAIKKSTLALRKLLEKEDIPAVLRQYGIFPDGRRVPLEKLPLLDETGKKRRIRLEAIIDREVQAIGGNQKSGVERYCREVAFTYLNRLIALRSMEVRGLIDECIKIRNDYAGRSLRHHRFLKENPGVQFDSEDAESLKAFLRTVFRELQDDIKILFDPDDEYSIIIPSIQAVRECIRAFNEDIPEDAFKEPELIGWVYQYFQTEEKDRVFEEVRTKKKKIEGDDIIPATSLYTERYMVDYLVQNSLGTIWMEMYPDSKLCENWQYFVKDQDLNPREPRPNKSLTFLDPACGSGHFLLVAFDLLVQMYEEEARLASEGKVPKEWAVPKEKIGTTILEYNLHGIDIDLRSVQLSYLVLYLRMRDYQKSVGAPKSLPAKINLVAADASLLNTPEFLTWCEEKFKEEPYAFNITKGIVGRLRNLLEIGSLARPEEDLKELVHKEKERLLSAWKKEKAPHQTFLFREMLKPEQQELPFDKVTDDQFWGGVLSQVTKALDEYYRDASKRGDTRAQILAHEASRGFKFLELCNKRFDVVATNPPYMGQINMGQVLRSYIHQSFSQTKYDLFASFVVRCLELSAIAGFSALVTQEVWMTSKQYSKWRKWLLHNIQFRQLAHLGSHAFGEIKGGKVSTTLAIFFKVSPTWDSFYWAVRANDIDTPNLKDICIKNAANSRQYPRAFLGKQKRFLSIPSLPIAYWASDALCSLLGRQDNFGNVLENANFTKTGDNSRYLRFFWELFYLKVGLGKKWIWISKGTPFCRWVGSWNVVVDWSESARKHYRNDKVARITQEEFIGVGGITYCTNSTTGLAARLIPRPGVSLYNSPTLISKQVSLETVLSILNSRFVTFILRIIAGPLAVVVNDIYRVPTVLLRLDLSNRLHRLGRSALLFKKESITNSVVESDFEPSSIQIQGGSFSLWESQVNDRLLKASCGLSTIVGLIDEAILFSGLVTEQDKEIIIQTTGTPAAWYSLIKGYDTIEETYFPEITAEMIDYNKSHNLVTPSPDDLAQIKSCLRELYQVGPGITLEDEDVIEEGEFQTREDDDENGTFVDKFIPIPNETFLEELSVKMKIHPISIYWLLKEMREKEGLVCWPECKRYVEDYFTVIILKMLEFRWPKQIEAGEHVPDWADKDGIIPITKHTEEKTLLERIRDRIGAEFGEDRISDIESEFADILYNAACKEAEMRGKITPKKRVTLAQWVEKEFFRRHTSQFKKRPVAWHVTSLNGTFQVLIFCHKISLDMFKNLKNRHLAKVQSYYGSLLERARRGESVPAGLTAGKLSDIVFELEEFSNKLDKLIAMPYEPLIDDGVRVNIAPLQKLGLLASPVLAPKDVDRAIADRNRWREDDKEQATLWRI